MKQPTKETNQCNEIINDHLKHIRSKAIIFFIELFLLVFFIIQMKVKENIDILAKIIIIGDSGVGKTNLILRFVGESFK